MKVKEVKVERLKNTGNYENEKLGVTIVLAEGESPKEAVERGRKFLEKCLNHDDDSDRRINKQIVNNPDNYTGARVKQAQQWLEENPEFEFDF